MIDLIIPAYNAHDYILNGLYSILLQSCVDKLKVYIVNDCSDRDYSEEIDKVKDKINIVELKTPENMGPGFARQYGVDNSDSEFIIFMDADDVFYDAYSIESLYNELKNNDYNYIISDFIEETPFGNFDHYYNNIWMHGKMYRREFLVNNKIIFNNSSQNEDTGFNTLTNLCSDNTGYLNRFTYIWKYNENSITRRNSNEFEFIGLEGFIKNICWAIKEAGNKNANIDKIAKVTYETMIEVYYNYIKFDYNEKLCEWSRELKELFLKYKNRISRESKEDAMYSMIQKGLDLAGADKILNNKINFEDFLNIIE